MPPETTAEELDRLRADNARLSNELRALTATCKRLEKSLALAFAEVQEKVEENHALGSLLDQLIYANKNAQDAATLTLAEIIALRQAQRQ